MPKLQSLIRIDIKNIGGCPFCITQSLKLAVFAGAEFAAVLAIQQWWQSSASVWISGVVGATFVSLWLLHVAVYGLKAARFAKHRAQTEADGLGVLDPRRRFLVTFAKAAAGIAAFTTLSMLSVKRASASMIDCGYGTRCNYPYTFCCYTYDPNAIGPDGGRGVESAHCCPHGTRCDGGGCASSQGG